MSDQRRRNAPPKEEAQAQENAVFGRNPVLELLKSEKTVEKIFVQSGEREGSIKMIVALAAAKKIPVLDASKRKLDFLSGNANHQGVVALASGVEYVELEDILAIARERGEKPFVVLADGISDPHNLGALIRCCEGAGVHGVVIPKRRAACVTAAAVKASAGAVEHMALCKVSNLADAVEKLKKSGLWIFACEAGGEGYDRVDLDLPLAVVMGGEETGVSRLIKEKSDFVISLPMKGKVNSLNVSCAAAVILYRVLWERSGR